MNDRKIKLPTLLEMVISGLILGTLSCCSWPIVRDSRGPRGDPIPEQPPNEVRRIRDPSGFSMVVPPNWDSFTDGLFMMAPMSPGPYARRSKALIVVSCMGQSRPTELEGLSEVDFQGQVAYEGMKVVREDTFDDPPWSEYQLFLHHGEDWYMVTYGIAEERTTLPYMVRQYINTFRWE